MNILVAAVWSTAPVAAQWGGLPTTTFAPTPETRP